MNKILILPFNIDNSIADLNYLSDGIFEELTNIITTTSNLKTTSRSTSFFLLNNPTPTIEIKKRYQIDFIIEGNIKYNEGTYQLSTRLFKTDNEELLLNNSSEFNLEKWTQPLDALAIDIIAVIKEGKLDKKNTIEDHSKAREYYLRGMYHWHRYTHEEMLLAIGFFKKSIK